MYLCGGMPFRDQGTNEAEEKVARRQVRHPELLRKAKHWLRQFELRGIAEPSA